MTGYDLFKAFESSVGYVWYAPDSQIYPELKRMEKEGLLEGEEVVWGTRGKKRQYHVTEAGITAFREWINSPIEYSRERDPVHLRAAYLEWADPESSRAQMRAHITHYAGWLAQWTEKVREIDDDSNAMLTKRLATADPAEHRRIRAFKKFTYQGMVARAEQEIAWAERGLALIDDLYPGSS